jgi:hypothetical protein
MRNCISVTLLSTLWAPMAMYWVLYAHLGTLHLLCVHCHYNCQLAYFPRSKMFFMSRFCRCSRDIVWWMKIDETFSRHSKFVSILYMLMASEWEFSPIYRRQTPRFSCASPAAHANEPRQRVLLSFDFVIVGLMSGMFKRGLCYTRLDKLLFQ